MKGWICLLLALLLGGCGPAGEVRGMAGEADRLWYLEQQGLEPRETPISVQEIRLPESFPPVLEDYNRLQQRQGFDLTRYAGKKLTVYTYELCGDTGGQLLFASLYQYKSRIVGGDVHSAALSGYMGPLAAENG